MIIYRVYEYMDFHALFLDKADVVAFLKSLPYKDIEDLKVERYDTENRIKGGELVPNFTAPAASFLGLTDA